MQNIVGTAVPTEDEAQKLASDIAGIIARLEKYCITLSTEARQTTLKMRTGGERIAQTVGNLASEHGVTLPNISVEAMNSDLLLAQRLKPVALQAERLALLLSDTVLEANSEAWWAATAYYTTLARMAGAEPKLESSLKPAVEFFATGRRKPKNTP